LGCSSIFVVFGFVSKEVTRTRNEIGSMMFRESWAFGLRRKPTPPIEAFMLFFVADDVNRAQPFPVGVLLDTNATWKNRCFCTQTISCWYWDAETVSSFNCVLPLSVLVLKDEICNFCVDFMRWVFFMSTVACFLTVYCAVSAWPAPCLPARRAMREGFDSRMIILNLSVACTSLWSLLL